MGYALNFKIISTHLCIVYVSSHDFSIDNTSNVK